jgi:hypothetical protein
MGPEINKTWASNKNVKRIIKTAVIRWLSQSRKP